MCILFYASLSIDFRFIYAIGMSHIVISRDLGSPLTHHEHAPVMIG
jgi:hypothetical protein